MAARINGPHACGHPSKYLAESQAARAMIAQWATEDCYHCQRMARDIAAVQEAQRLGLPDLVGSDKQVSWARTVRDEARVMLAAWVDKNSTVSDVAASEALLYGITDAGWWIDRKGWAADQYIAWMSPIVTIALGYAQTGGK